MRKLSTERRRVAVICAACAAIIPSAGLLTFGSHSSPTHFFAGLAVGMAFALSIGMLVKSRRSCA